MRLVEPAQQTRQRLPVDAVVQEDGRYQEVDRGRIAAARSQGFGCGERDTGIGIVEPGGGLEAGSRQVLCMLKHKINRKERNT